MKFEVPNLLAKLQKMSETIGLATAQGERLRRELGGTDHWVEFDMIGQLLINIYGRLETLERLVKEGESAADAG